VEDNLDASLVETRTQDGLEVRRDDKPRRQRAKEAVTDRRPESAPFFEGGGAQALFNCPYSGDPAHELSFSSQEFRLKSCPPSAGLR